MYRIALVTLTALAAALVVPVAAQAPPEDLSGFVDVIDVQVINVDVFVDQKNGKPVLGLTEDDFEIFVNGRPMPISNFYAVEKWNPRAGGIEPVPLVEPAAPTAPPAKDVEVPVEQKLHLVIYVDNVNIHPGNRNKTMSRIRSFLLRQLGPEDRVMLVTYDRSLHERVPFTTNKGEILDALFALEKVAAHGTQARRRRQEVLDAIFDARSSAEVGGLVTTYAEALYSDTDFSIDALRRTVDSLAGLPGRKAVLYVSDGVSMRAAEDLYVALEEELGDNVAALRAYEYDLTHRFELLAAQANSHRVMLYTIDAAGMRTHANADVESQHSRSSSAIASTHLANIQDPLYFMAHETGGRVIVNTNNFGPMLDRVAADFSTYYSLGFTPATSGNGRYHKIEVKLKGGKRKGVRLRHREGYRDKPLSKQMEESTHAALTYGYEKNEMGLEITFGRPQSGDGRSMLLPMVVKIPMDQLTFIPIQGTARSQLQLYVSARAEDGGKSEVETFPVNIAIPENDLERARQHKYHLQHTLQILPGRRLVAVGVRDSLGAQTSFVLKPVQVGG